MEQTEMMYTINSQLEFKIKVNCHKPASMAWLITDINQQLLIEG